MALTKKHLFIALLIPMMTFSLIGMNTQAGHAAAGTTAAFNSKTESQAVENAWVTFHFDTLNANSLYIIVQSTVGNKTFSTGSGETTKQVRFLMDSSGSLNFAVYGYNITSGTSQGSILDNWLITVDPASDYNSDLLTDNIPFFIGLMVAGLILGVAVKRAF